MFRYDARPKEDVLLPSSRQRGRDYLYVIANTRNYLDISQILQYGLQRVCHERKTRALVPKSAYGWRYM